MATIPLPALHVNTDQQSPLALYAQAQQIRNQQQQQQLTATEVQQRQIQLQDQQATTAAMKEWDGKNPDDLPPLVLKNGGSSTAVFGLKNQILDWKTKAANLNKDQLDNLNKTNDIIAGHFEAVKNAKPEDKAGVYTDSMQDLQDKGLVKPGQFPAQYPGDDVVDMWEKQHMGQKAIVEQAQKDKEVAAQTATAQSRAATAQTSALRLQAELPGGALRSPEQKEMDDFVKNPPKGYQGTPQDFAKWKASLAPQAGIAAQAGGNPTAPLSDTVIDALAAPGAKLKIGDVLTPRTPLPVRQAAIAQILQKYPDFKTSDYDLEKGVMKSATSGKIADSLTAFNTAISHAQQAQADADAMGNDNWRSLNKLSNALGVEFGSDKVTNFNAVKSALTGEVSKVFKGGQATDAEIKEVQGPLNAANSPAQLKGALDTVIHLMNSKRDALKQQVEQGSQAKPNFGEGGGAKKVLSPSEWLAQQKKP